MRRAGSSRAGWVAISLALGALGGCSRSTELTPLPPTHFETAIVRLASETDTLHMRLELATSTGQQAVGLMERAVLPDSAGMLFLYDRYDDRAFYMFRTSIPLDIAFLDERGVILRIQSMEPCPSIVARHCPRYPSGVAFFAALEVNRDFFSRNGFAVGDRLLLEDLPTLPANGGR